MKDLSEQTQSLIQMCHCCLQSPVLFRGRWLGAGPCAASRGEGGRRHACIQNTHRIPPDIRCGGPHAVRLGEAFWCLGPKPQTYLEHVLTLKWKLELPRNECPSPWEQILGQPWYGIWMDENGKQAGCVSQSLKAKRKPLGVLCTLAPRSHLWAQAPVRYSHL